MGLWGILGLCIQVMSDHKPLIPIFTTKKFVDELSLATSDARHGVQFHHLSCVKEAALSQWESYCDQQKYGHEHGSHELKALVVNSPPTLVDIPAQVCKALLQESAHMVMQYGTAQ